MNQKKQNGITLIALVITIIVLLILAGVVIATLSGDNSAPQKATEAAQKDVIAGAKDEIAMQTQEALLNYYNSTYVTGNETGAPEVQGVVETAAGTAVTNAKSRNKELLETSGVDTAEHKITLNTKSYTVTGIIGENGGITWSDSNTSGGETPSDPSEPEEPETPATGVTASEVNAKIGKKVNYTAEASSYEGTWRVFYADSNYVYIISTTNALSGYALNGSSKADQSKYADGAGASVFTEGQSGGKKSYSNVTYGATYNSRWLATGTTDAKNRSKAAAYLCDPAEWEDFVSSSAPSGTFAVGGPTKELLVNSWNAAKANNTTVTGAPTTEATWADGDVIAEGYLWNKPAALSNDNRAITTSVVPLTVSGTSYGLYNPLGTSGNSYWLASPCSDYDDVVCFVDFWRLCGRRLL